MFATVEVYFSELRGLFTAVAVKYAKIGKQNVRLRIGVTLVDEIVHGLIFKVAGRVGRIQQRLVLAVHERGLALKPNLVAVFHVLAVALDRVGRHAHIDDHIRVVGGRHRSRIAQVESLIVYF